MTLHPSRDQSLQDPRGGPALFFDGLSAPEIADITGKPVATVRSHLRHARKSLKEVIVSEYP
jgi:hypothetical protein